MDTHTSLILVLPPLFLFFWWSLFTLLGRAGGWSALAERYRRDDAFPGMKWRFLSGQMRKQAAYNNALTVGADRRGLFLAVSFFFFPSHPKLFVPWSDISAVRQDQERPNSMQFWFLNVPGVFLKLPLELGEKILAVRDGKVHQRNAG